MRVSKHPHHRASHWTAWSSYEFLDAIDFVIVAAMIRLFVTVAVLAISIDEVTTINGQSRMSVHLYYVNKHWERQHCFVALPRLHGSPDAANIVTTLLAAIFSVLRMDKTHLASRVVMFACDGASVLQGVHTGVTTRLMAIMPFVQRMHCYAHRFDLAAGILAEALAMIAAAALFSSPHTFYSHSNARKDALKQVRLPDRHVQRRGHCDLCMPHLFCIECRHSWRSTPRRCRLCRSVRAKRVGSAITAP